jgi:hypothetical protein
MIWYAGCAAVRAIEWSRWMARFVASDAWFGFRNERMPSFELGLKNKSRFRFEIVGSLQTRS